MISSRAAVDRAIDQLGPTVGYSMLHADRWIKTLDWCKKLIPPPARVLDLGVWPGYQSLALLEFGYSVTGLDIESQRLTSRVTEVIPVVNANLNTTDVLQILQGQFDLVVATEIIEHLQPNLMDSLFQQLRRLAHTDGALLITTPNSRRLNGLRRHAAHGADTHGHGHEHEYTVSELRVILERNGWQIERAHPVNFYGRVGKVSNQEYFPLGQWWRKPRKAHNILKGAGVVTSILIPNWRDSIVVIARKS